MNPPPFRFFATSESRRLAWLGGCALVLAGLALNLSVLGFRFLPLMDDDINVTLNPHLGGWDGTMLRWAFTDTAYVRRYMPLGWLGFSTAYEAGGLDPVAYHAAALLYYTANAGLLVAGLLHILRLWHPAGRVNGLEAWPVGAALLAGAWWAAHPLRVESTAWVSGLLYGQAMAFFLVSVLAYLRSLVALECGRRRLPWLAVSLAALTASLLTYPLVLGAPLLFAAVDYLYARYGSAQPRPNLARLLAEKAWFFVPTAGITAVTLAARLSAGTVWGAAPTWSEFPLPARAAQAAYITAYYIWKPWWPFHLSPAYASLFDVNPLAPRFLASFAGCAFLGSLALSQIRRSPWVAACVGAYVAMMIPYFGWTETPHYASDRYAYFPTLLAAALIASGLAGLGAGGFRGSRAIATAIALVACAFLGILTRRQLPIWHDSRTLYAAIIRSLPEGEMRDGSVGRALLLDFLGERGDAARRALEEPLRRHPNSPGLRKVASLMGVSVGETGTAHSADSLIEAAGAAFAFSNHVPVAAYLQESLGRSLAKSGRLSESNDHLSEALLIDSGDAEAAYNRALVRAQLGRTRDALHDYLWAEGRLRERLPEAQRRAFYSLLRASAEADGDGALLASLRKRFGSGGGY